MSVVPSSSSASSSSSSSASQVDDLRRAMMANIPTRYDASVFNTVFDNTPIHKIVYDVLSEYCKDYIFLLYSLDPILFKRELSRLREIIERKGNVCYIDKDIETKSFYTAVMDREFERVPQNESIYDICSDWYLKQPTMDPIAMVSLLSEGEMLRPTQQEWLVQSYRDELMQTPMLHIGKYFNAETRKYDHVLNISKVKTPDQNGLTCFLSIHESLVKKGKTLRQRVPELSDIMESVSSAWVELIDAPTGTGKTLMGLLRAASLMTRCNMGSPKYRIQTYNNRFHKPKVVATYTCDAGVIPLLIAVPLPKLEDWENELKRIDWRKVVPHAFTQEGGYIEPPGFGVSLTNIPRVHVHASSKEARKSMRSQHYQHPTIIICSSQALIAFSDCVVTTMIIDDLGNPGSGKTMEGLHIYLPRSVHHIIYLNATPIKYRGEILFPQRSLFKMFRHSKVTTRCETPVATLTRWTSPSATELELFQVALEALARLLEFSYSHKHKEKKYYKCDRADRMLKLCCRVFEGSGPMLQPEALKALLTLWFNGLTPEARNALPVTPEGYAKVAPQGDTTVCWICHGELDTDTTDTDLLPVQSPCRHVVHWGCVSIWLKHGSTCYCRHSLLPHQLLRMYRTTASDSSDLLSNTISEGPAVKRSKGVTLYRDAIDHELSESSETLLMLTSKIEETVKVCEEEKGHGNRGVVFTTSKQETQLLKDALLTKHISSTVIPQAKGLIARAVNTARMDDSIDVLIIPHNNTLGMNLDFCTYYVKVNTKWCHSKHKQDRGRITRGGGVPVRFYTILQPGGFDAVAHWLPSNGTTCMRQAWMLFVMLHVDDSLSFKEPLEEQWEHLLTKTKQVRVTTSHYFHGVAWTLNEESAYKDRKYKKYSFDRIKERFWRVLGETQ